MLFFQLSKDSSVCHCELMCNDIPMHPLATSQVLEQRLDEHVLDEKLSIKSLPLLRRLHQLCKAVVIHPEHSSRSPRVFQRAISMGSPPNITIICSST